MTLPLCVLGAGVVHGLCVAALLPMLVTLPTPETSKRAQAIVPVDTVAARRPVHSAEAKPQPSIAFAPGMGSVAADVPSKTLVEVPLGDDALTTASLPATAPQVVPPDDGKLEAAEVVAPPAAEDRVAEPEPVSTANAETEPSAPAGADVAGAREAEAAPAGQSDTPVERAPEKVTIEPVSTASQPQPVVPEETMVEAAPETGHADPSTTQSTTPLAQDAGEPAKDSEATHTKPEDIQSAAVEAAPAAEPVKTEEAEQSEGAKSVASADPAEAVPADAEQKVSEPEAPQATAKPTSPKRPTSQTGQAKPRAVSPPKAQAQPAKTRAAPPAKRTVSRARRPAPTRTAAQQPARGGMFKLFAGPGANTGQSAVRR